MARKMFTRPELNEDQKQLADLIFQRIAGTFETAARQIAERMASKETSQLLGATEFELRDRVHELGYAAKKRGLIWELAAFVRSVRGMPSSSVGRRKRS
jgi:hypothetical protein